MTTYVIKTGDELNRERAAMAAWSMLPNALGTSDLNAPSDRSMGGGCPHCKRSFATGSGLQNHINNKHQ